MAVAWVARIPGGVGSPDGGGLGMSLVRRPAIGRRFKSELIIWMRTIRIMFFYSSGSHDLIFRFLPKSAAPPSPPAPPCRCPGCSHPGWLGPGPVRQPRTCAARHCGCGARRGARHRFPAYTVADLYATYKLSPKTQVRLNLFNAFDKRYIQQLAEGGGQGIPGPGRQFIVTLRHDF